MNQEKDNLFLVYCCRRQYLDLTLPSGFTCSKCQIRLIRSADEWGPFYKFWSCADVTILPRSTCTNPDTCCFDGKCLNGGTCNQPTGSCTCPRLFSGSRCEVYGTFVSSRISHFVFILVVRSRINE